jgi:uncharacterized membrane protein
VVLLGNLLLSAINTGAVTVAISGRYLGREVSIGPCYRAAFRKVGTIIGAWIVAGILIGLGFFMLVFPGVIWALSFCLITPIVMVEGLPAGQSRKRSRELTKGFRWQTLGLFLIYLLVVYGLYFIVTLVTRLFVGSMPGLDSTSFIARLINLAVQVVLAPFSRILTVLIYYNQRIRKEGFDLELLAEALAEE